MMRQSQAFRAAAIGAATLCGLVLAGVATAKQPAMASSETAKQTREEQFAALRANLKDPDVFALSNAMRAFVDPQTGELREPSAEELAELGRAAGRVRSFSTVAPEVFELSGGGIGAAVPAELTSYSIVDLRDDGTVAFSCHQGDAPELSTSIAPVAASTVEEQ